MDKVTELLGLWVMQRTSEGDAKAKITYKIADLVDVVSDEQFNEFMKRRRAFKAWVVENTTEVS